MGEIRDRRNEDGLPGETKVKSQGRERASNLKKEKERKRFDQALRPREVQPARKPNRSRRGPFIPRGTGRIVK